MAVAPECAVFEADAVGLDPWRWVCLEAAVPTAALPLLRLPSPAMAPHPSPSPSPSPSSSSTVVLFPLPRAAALRCATVAALLEAEELEGRGGGPGDGDGDGGGRAPRVPLAGGYPPEDVYFVSLYARLPATPAAALAVPVEHFDAALSAAERRLLAAAEQRSPATHPARRLARIAQLAEFLQCPPLATLLAGRVAWHMAHATGVFELRRMLWPEDVAAALPRGPGPVDAGLHLVPAEGGQSAAVVLAKVCPQRLLGGSTGLLFSRDAQERVIEEMRLD